MRISELTEAWYTTRKTRRGDTVEIFRNPSRREFQRLERQGRATLDSAGNLYLWDLDILHDEVEEVLNRDTPGLLRMSLILSMGQVLWTEFEYARDEDGVYDAFIASHARVVLDNPNIARLLGPGYEVWGQDEHDDFPITDDWLKERVSLQEAYLATPVVTNDWGDKRHVEVFKNPSRTEFFKLLHQCEGDAASPSMRGHLLPSGDLIVWDGWRVQHHEMLHALGLPEMEGIRLFLDPTGVGMHASPDDDVMEEEVATIKTHPRLERIFGKGFKLYVG